MSLRFYECARDCQVFWSDGIIQRRRRACQRSNRRCGRSKRKPHARQWTMAAGVLYFGPTEECPSMRAKQMRLRRAAGFTFGILLTGPTRLAAQDPCQPTYDAMSKVMSTPTHIYTTMTGVRNNAGKHTVEIIYVGGATYVNVGGKWSRSPMPPQHVTQKEEENRKGRWTTCDGCSGLAVLRARDGDSFQRRVLRRDHARILRAPQDDSQPSTSLDHVRPHT